MHKFKFFLLAILLMGLTACSPKVQTPMREPVVSPSYTPLVPSEYLAFGPKSDAPPEIIRNRIPKPLLVVIDPGHGGQDLGTTSKYNPTFHEKAVNLITAQVLQTYLQQMGFRTLMTRQSDLFIPLKKRSQFANDQNADLYISVHYNSAPVENAHGIEVFYYNSEENKKKAAASKEMAKYVLEEVIKKTGAKSRGVKHGNLAVIRETQMPAILIEGGFFTNQDEFNKIRDPSYVRKIAWGIAQGLSQYSTKNVLGAN